MAGRPCLHQATFVKSTGLMAIHIAEMNFHTGEFVGKPL
jgi:hypothetical protein